MSETDFEKLYEAVKILEEYKGSVEFTPREIGLIKDILRYTSDMSFGLPGHNIFILMDKMLTALNELNVKGDAHASG